MTAKLMCTFYITILLFQIVYGNHLPKWKGRHSKERPPRPHSKESEEDCEDNDVETEEDCENCDEESEYQYEDENGDSRASESESVEKNTTTVSCRSGYCYHVIRNTTYPPKCPFFDDVSFAEYNNVILNILAGVFGIYYWLDIKKNPQYGYYEWLELGDNYGTIFNETANYGGECVTLGLGLTNTYMTENCSNINRGLCVYRLYDKNKNFCNIYEEICGTSAKCYCYAKRYHFTCQIGCQNYQNADCDVCENKFDNYPEPSIYLKFVRSHNLIYVVVKNSLKLTYSNEDKLIFCFTDVYAPSESKIRDKYEASEINVDQIHDDIVIYSIKPRDLGPGQYWCEGFQFPNREKIKSNTIVAGIVDAYGANFVLNLTVQLSNQHTFLPYNIHTKTTEAFNEMINFTNFKSVRPAYISEVFNDEENVNISLHITTTIGTDTSEAYTTLINGLNSLSSKEIMVDTLSSSKTCITTVTTIDGKEVVWPEAELGSTTPPIGIFLQENGVPITRSCLGSFQLGATWSEVAGSISSRSISPVTEALYELNSSNKTANELNVGLNELLNHYDEYIPYDVYLIALIFRSIAESKEPFGMDLYMENINTIMEFETDILKMSQTTLNATDIILYSFDLALISSIVNNKRNETDIHNVTVTRTENILAQVVNLKANNNIIGIAVYEEDGHFIMTNITNGTLVSDVNLTDLLFATFLPPTLLDQVLQEQEGEEVNMATAVFLNGMLFNSQNNTKTHDSAILGLYIQGYDSVFFNETIPVIFKSISSKNNEKHCGFWNYGMNELWVNIFGYWKVDEYAIYNDTYSMCNFTHMTHFALLVSGVEDIILNYISLIGCVLSIFGLIGIFLTAVVSKSWREGSGTKILLNYCAAILIQMIILLFSDLVNGETHKSLCILFGIILHYTILSQFLWMLIISYLQYRKFVLVLVQEPTNVITKSCLFAWSSPVLIIIIVASSDINAYCTQNNCYLSGISLYIGLFLPIIAVISANIVLFILIFKSVLYRKTQAYGVNKRLIGLKVKLAVILFFLMGFSWIFGIFAGMLKSLFLSYIFSLTSTIQGLVMYLYFVVCNKTTRKIWLRKIDQMRGALISRSKLVNEFSTSDEEPKFKK